NSGNECGIHTRPGFARSIHNRPRCVLWPIAGSFEVRVCPSQDLLDGQLGQISLVAYSSVLSQNARQRGLPRKPSTPLSQGNVNREPCLAWGFGNGARFLARPTCKTNVVCVRPGQNLIYGQRPWRSIRQALGKLTHLPASDSVNLPPYAR